MEKPGVAWIGKRDSLNFLSIQSFNPQQYLPQGFGLSGSLELQQSRLSAPPLFLIKALLLGCRQQKIIFRCCRYSQRGAIETHYHSQV